MERERNRNIKISSTWVLIINLCRAENSNTYADWRANIKTPGMDVTVEISFLDCALFLQTGASSSFGICMASPAEGILSKTSSASRPWPPSEEAWAHAVDFAGGKIWGISVRERRRLVIGRGRSGAIHESGESLLYDAGFALAPTSNSITLAGIEHRAGYRQVGD